MLMKKKEEGQALLELIIFLPLMFTIYAVITGFANAIFGSINQQKAARAYFYYRVQNNSTIPRRPDQNASWTKYGTFFIGWREKTIDEFPVAPCYRISIPVTDPADSNCDEQYTADSESTPSTQFMRVGTVYGMCGATYQRQNNLIFHSPNRQDLNYRELVDRDTCTIQ